MTRHSAPLASFTVVTPGLIKDNKLTRRISSHSVTALFALAEQSIWAVREQTALVSASGPESLSSIEAPVYNLKLVAIELGHSRPLGRLWNIDVLTFEGEILFRRHSAFPACRCLLCEQSTAGCAQGKAHALSDLLIQTGVLLYDVDSHSIN